MKLKDKKLLKFSGMAFVGGALTYCIINGIRSIIGGTFDWLLFGYMAVSYGLLWVLGALVAWLTSKTEKRLSLKTYLWTNCFYIIFTAIELLFYGNPLADFWYIASVIFFLLFSILPAAFISSFIHNIFTRKSANTEHDGHKSDKEFQ